jgi:nucleotide-binding universal stress UspA family protein
VNVQVNVTGLTIALAIVASISAVLYWMLHPPRTKADRAAAVTQTHIDEIIGSIIVVFSADIHSEHMMALALRLARKERANLLAAYFIEVPLTLPLAADMETEQRQALEVLATAEALARGANVEIQTEIVPARAVSQGVLDLAKRTDAHLLVLGAYREGKYAGAPLYEGRLSPPRLKRAKIVFGVRRR